MRHLLLSGLLIAGAAASPTMAAPSPGTPSRPQPTAKNGGPTWSIPFLEDDYPAALAQARSKKEPLFVKIWSPW